MGARSEVRGADQQMTAPSKGEFIDSESQRLHGASPPLVTRMENALWDDGLSFLLCCLPTVPKPPKPKPTEELSEPLKFRGIPIPPRARQRVGGKSDAKALGIAQQRKSLTPPPLNRKPSRRSAARTPSTCHESYILCSECSGDVC